jgi:hypothetical protein
MRSPATLPALRLESPACLPGATPPLGSLPLLCRSCTHRMPYRLPLRRGGVRGHGARAPLPTPTWGRVCARLFCGMVHTTGGDMRYP